MYFNIFHNSRIQGWVLKIYYHHFDQLPWLIKSKENEIIAFHDSACGFTANTEVFSLSQWNWEKREETCNSTVHFLANVTAANKEHVQNLDTMSKNVCRILWQHKLCAVRMPSTKQLHDDVISKLSVVTCSQEASCTRGTGGKHNFHPSKVVRSSCSFLCLKEKDSHAVLLIALSLVFPQSFLISFAFHFLN